MSQSLIIIMTATPLAVGVMLVLAALVMASSRMASFLMACAFVLIVASPLQLVALSPEAAPSLIASIAQSQIYQAVVVLGVFAAFAALLWALARPRTQTAEHKPSLPVREGRVHETRHLRIRRLLRREHEKLASANQMQHYLELATRNSQITVFLQNADLEYLWIVNPRLGFSSQDVVGKSDYDILPEEAQPLVIGHKRRAMATGSTQTFEIELSETKDKAWFRVDVVPVAERDGTVGGVVCTAIDITRAKRLDIMRTDLSRRLAETLQRFNLALRSERIVVFSQDLSMRYTWANSDETQVGSVIGRTDDELIPAADRPAIMALKQRAIATKRPQSGEVGLGEGIDRRWYDLHVEPNVQPDGQVSGITCASIDITHRKRNEEQMREVMRELTHRTKNLLAVVIAIARQTSTQSTNIDDFVPSLVGRLRALSAAQDLIVADDWAGVAIEDLVGALLSQHVSRGSSRVIVGGPKVILSPEASQNLGLAIHELASNAAQFGALSTTRGTVRISWALVPGAQGEALDLVWEETGGPTVGQPTKRGFGMMVIERNLARALAANVSLEFGCEGLKAHISMPLSSLTPQPKDEDIIAAAS